MGGINKDIKAIIEQLMDDLKADLMERFDKFSKEVELKLVSLEQENIKLREQVRKLESYSLGDSLEIFSIPVQEDENVEDIVIKVNKQFALDITKRDISHCYRIPVSKAYKGKNPPKIFVKYTRRTDRNYLLNKKSVKVTLRDIGHSGDGRVHIYESLSQVNKQLYYKALDFKKQHSYKFLWTKNNNIYLRYTDKSKAHQVSSEECLGKLHDHTIAAPSMDSKRITRSSSSKT